MRTMAIAALVAAIPAASAAEVTCPRGYVSWDKGNANLGENFGEVPVFQGIRPRDGMVFHVYLSPRGSWTVIMTRPDGCSRTVTDGQAGSVMTPEQFEHEREAL